ncbi:restriction endonuclease [Candidatus Epulonipiscium viviparus]|uniref:restriction endonuclease n=1 Tax=Candidatus Epulonipiscium viviparus TaxID=420336 RepID=UPI0004968855|nr:restriction endonuclease [Candidatus Epulopiscium viviparus]
MLVSVFRIMLLTISGYLYYLFIFKDMNSTPMGIEIVLMVSLLVAMIFTKLKASRMFDEKSDIEIIDTMDQGTFVNYISELYKHTGYAVNLPSDAEKKYCDIIVYHRRGKICVKCFNHEIDLTKTDLGAFKKQNVEYKRTKFIIVANSFCDEELKQQLWKDKIEVFERDFLEGTLKKLRELREKRDLSFKLSNRFAK